MDYKWRKLGNDNQGEIIDSWTPELKGELIGKYLGPKLNVGRNASTIYQFEQENGEKIGVWSSAVLDSRMKEVKVGDVVKITYLGKETNPKTGRVFKNFDFEIGDPISESEAKTTKKKIVKDKDENDIPF